MQAAPGHRSEQLLGHAKGSESFNSPLGPAFISRIVQPPGEIFSLPALSLLPVLHSSSCVSCAAQTHWMSSQQMKARLA